MFTYISIEEFADGVVKNNKDTNRKELIAALRGVTGERIAAAAQSLTLDTVYFLTAEEDGEDE